ncbi:unnamed protein product [Vitrella brassicaformis CCMP3155]|uniref:NUC153 domain-containing protein n=3 Tax=Vitrella brassicaformis TaxID=1169539 RepID=A0A0G4F364_VITBC|nr:unnamed protein product [Vitrella brassicaformis CCMP3155]|eukprot:CEM06089.1 unnamed protein product [Vitrella brassicaformis CCMP3155]
MEVVSRSTRVYDLSSGKSLPDFVEHAQRHNKSLRRDASFRRRIELLQSFEFTVASSSVKVSPDGSFIAATGIYPPSVKVYETSELSLKFDRRVDSEVVDLIFLSQDYRKLVLLEFNRWVEFHAQGGRHHRIRVPKEGRCMSYDPDTCEVYVVGSSEDIYRIDVETGVFEEPLKTTCAALNACAVCPTLPLLVTAGEGGIIEAWDTRASTRRPASTVDLYSTIDPSQLPNGRSATALSFSGNGLSLAVGCVNGILQVLDIRSSRPYWSHATKTSAAIRAVQCFHRGRAARASDFGDAADGGAGTEQALFVAAVDAQTLRVCSAAAAPAGEGGGGVGGSSSSSPPVAVVESAGGGSFNSVCVYPDSGMVFVPRDDRRIGLYFIPTLGLAPTWCSFLDGLTEELEEGSQAPGVEGDEGPPHPLYEDFRFVTQAQLAQLGADHLLGTPLVRAYLHGYFMDARLYSQLKAATTTASAYELHRKQRIRDKMQDKQPMRIQVKHHLPKVNAALASRLQETVQAATQGGGGKASKKVAAAAERASSLLTDKRFEKLFSNPDFAIMEEDEATGGP